MLSSLQFGKHIYTKISNATKISVVCLLFLFMQIIDPDKHDKPSFQTHPNGLFKLVVLPSI